MRPEPAARFLGHRQTNRPIDKKLVAYHSRQVSEGRNPGGNGVWAAIILQMNRRDPDDGAYFLDHVISGVDLAHRSLVLGLRDKCLKRGPLVRAAWLASG